MTVFRICMCCLIFSYASYGFAASFDCSKASTPIEKAICSDPVLSRLDSDLGAAYISLKKSLSEAQFNQLQKEQRQWLSQRNTECQSADTDCLIRLMRSRLAELEAFNNAVSDHFPCDTLQNRSVIDEIHVQFEKAKPGDVSPDQKYSLVVSDDGAVVLHDLAKKSKRVLHELEYPGCGSMGCMGSFQAARFAGNGRFAVTSSSFIGGPVIVWDTRTWKPVRELPGGFFCISGNSEYLAIMAHNWEVGYELFLYMVGRDKLVTLSGSDGITINGTTLWYSAETPDFGFAKDSKWLIATVGYKEYVVLSTETLSYTACYVQKDVSRGKQSNKQGGDIDLNRQNVKKEDVCEGKESMALISRLKEIDSYYEVIGFTGRDALNLYCKVKSAIETANHAAFAALIAYPVATSVDGRRTTIYTPQQFVDYAEKILTPSVINAVKETDFMEMFYNYRGLMFGNGQIWFNNSGIIGINN